ncbi:hypothetical protein OEZ85_011947 [Tetradesmus obliquus]|uniref:HECT-type E3 ubiquitin transferase n=1 Tax=Tetradesmus obliquus TaxID=3088 RepID=A0ABY8TRV5_TETOB|nr:hypothetical protein OEZ85_011947 [Tetradesmus obliquus]
MAVYSQVTLDSAAVLQQRYKQYNQLLVSLGLQHSKLAACVQPANKAVLACLQLGSRAAAGELRVPCVVRRRSAFWDALQQLQQQGIVTVLPDRQQQAAGAVQLAKLFPRFVDEQQQQQQQQQQHQLSSATGYSVVVEGGEGHGPRKEFFQLVGEGWSRADAAQPALFVHLRGPGTWWLNSTLSCSAQLQAAYWAVGWLLGQALVNRCTMGLQLAPLLFHRLLLQPHEAFQPSLAMLQQHDPEAAQGLQAVLQLPQQQYQQLLQVEGRPGSTSKQQYIGLALQQLLVEDVRWQLEALQQGFFTVLDRQVLLDCCFNGASMACALCGAAVDDSADFDVQKVFRVVVDDEDAASSSSSSQGGEDGTNQAAAGSGSGRPLSSEQLVLQCLWQVLAAWGPEQKRAFIKFVTGSSRLPPPGSEQLTVSFPFVAYSSHQQAQLLGTLPQSHTCANTLELPDYVEALTATQPLLMQEWQQATASWRSGGQAAGRHHQL